MLDFINQVQQFGGPPRKKLEAKCAKFGAISNNFRLIANISGMQQK